MQHEGSILECGIYVDLNQIRAGEALTTDESTRTSAYDRIRGRLERAGQSAAHTGGPQKAHAVSWLCELTLDERAEGYEGAAGSVTPRRASDKGLLPIGLDEYLELLDWTGRTVREGKQRAIPAHFAPILERLGISRTLWLDLVTRFDRLFGHVVGHSQQLVRRAAEAHAKVVPSSDLMPGRIRLTRTSRIHADSHARPPKERQGCILHRPHRQHSGLIRALRSFRLPTRVVEPPKTIFS